MQTLIHELEWRSTRGWPALLTRYYDGWILYFAEGHTRRANAIYPLFAASEEVERKINVCESIYREASLPPVFKMTANSQPPDLDDRLAARGYQRSEDVVVMTADLAQEDFGPPPEWIEVSSRLTRPWMKTLSTLHGYGIITRRLMSEMLEKVNLSSHYVRAMNGAEAVGVGRVVHDESLAGLFNIVVREDRRGQGIGRQITEALLHLAQAGGALTAYLQVGTDNTNALSLYETLGFQVAYHYWYRVLD